MNILLLRPPYRINRYARSVPLGYLILAAYLRENGHTPFIYDMLVLSSGPEKLDAFIETRNIQLIGIGCMTCEYREALDQARALKQRHPALPIVFGGAHPTGNPEQCFQTGDVDYVVAGEGELALTALMDAISHGTEPLELPGVWYRSGDRIVEGGFAAPVDIESLPFPAFDMIDLNAYFAMDPPWHFPKSRRVVQYITSRGCPFRCTYCHRLHGKWARLLSAKKVLDQMEILHRDYGVEEFIIVDDIFNVDIERAKSICRGIVERDLNIHLQFPNGVRGDVFDEELMALFSSAGTHYLAIAIETASARLQKMIKKNLDIDKALNVVGWARKYRVEVGGFFMIGFPGETKEEIAQSIALALNNPFDVVFFSIVTPYEGTEIRQDILNGVFGADAQAALLENPEEDFPVIYSRELDRKKLFAMRRNAYLKFYMKPFRLWNLLKKMRHFVYVRKIISAVFRRLFLNGRATVT